MPVEITEDWLDILDTTNYAPLKDPDNTYQSYRFKNLDIPSVTTKNFRKKLCPIFNRTSRNIYTSIR